MFIFVFMTISILFYFMGLTTNCTNDFCEGETPSAKLLDYAFNPDKISESSIGVGIVLALTSIAVVGISIGLFLTGRGDLAAAAPITLILISLGLDFLGIYTKVFSGGGVVRLISIFITPVFVVFMIVAVDWWRGQDV